MDAHHPPCQSRPVPRKSYIDRVNDTPLTADLLGEVMRTFAELPLIETEDDQAGFEPEAFRARVLKLSEAKGHS
jgi:hypothetical protein